jgi:ribonuclease E
MSETKNRKIVERSFREFLSRDKARIQTSSISSFGLLEMSRQRLRPSFLEINANICSHCSGKGVVRADESNAMLILRTVENEIFQGNYDMVNVYGVAGSIIYLLNNKRDEIKLIEKKYSVKLNFMIDPDATADSYSVEKIKLASKNKAENIHKQKPALQSKHTIYLDEETQQESPKAGEVEKEKISKNKRRKRKQAANKSGAPVANVASPQEDTVVADGTTKLLTETVETGVKTVSISESIANIEQAPLESNPSEAQEQRGKSSNANRPRKRINRRKVALKTPATDAQVNEN